MEELGPCKLRQTSGKHVAENCPGLIAALCQFSEMTKLSICLKSQYSEVFVIGERIIAAQRSLFLNLKSRMRQMATFRLSQPTVPSHFSIELP
jgi:hypothetical protein